MAAPTPQEIQRLQNLIKELERAYDRLGATNPLAGFDINQVRDINTEIDRLENELLGVQNRLTNIDQSFEGIASSLNEMLGNIKNSNNALNSTSKTFKGISNIVDKLNYDQQGISELNSKDLKSLQEKFKQRLADLQVNKVNLALELQKLNIEKQNLTQQKQAAEVRSNNNRLSQAQRDQAAEEANNLSKQLEKTQTQLDKNNKAYSETNEFLSGQTEYLQTIEDRLSFRLKQEEKLGEILGLSGATIEGMDKALNKMGLGRLSSILGVSDAREEMEDLGKKIIADKETQAKLEDELANKRGNLTDDDIRAGVGGNELKNLLEQKEALAQNNAQYDGMKGKITILQKGISSMGASLIKNLKDPLVISGFLVDQLLDALVKTDQATGDLAKSMGISYDESLNMVSSMTDIANLSGETYVTTENLIKAQMTLSKAFGTNVQLSGELLKDYAQITEQAGYSADAATALGKITQATGGDLSKNTASILGTAAAFNATNKLALNEKEIVEEVAKTGAATVLTFNKSTKALADNVLQAKKFGLNLEQASKISEGLLNFQSSIESELEAEVLTGKQLNFEQARFLALQGETGAAAAEVAKQIGGSAEFGKMNVIQQEALAKSVGLSRDELAQSILDREVLAKLGKEEGSAQDAYNKLKKQGLSDDAIAAKLGDEKLAAQLKSQSVQERFNATVAKLQDIFVSLAEPILNIVSPFMDLVTTILPLVNIVLQPIIYAIKFIGEAFQGFVSLIKRDLQDGLGGVLQIAQSIAVVWGGIVLAAKMFGKQQLINIVSQIKLGNLLKKDFWKSIATAIAKSWGAIVGFLGPFGIPVAIAASAGLVGLATKFFNANDMVSEGGYGKRTLLAPEGAIRLNDKDTVIAGTNLGGGGTQAPTSSPSIDLSPLLAKMDQMNTILNQLLAKEGTVTLDGNKVGTALSMGSYKLQ